MSTPAVTRPSAAPRKSSPLANLRKSSPVPPATVDPAPESVESTEPRASTESTESPNTTESTASAEASAPRSGQSLGYRQRRRGNAAGTAPVARARVDRSRLGLALAGGIGVVVIVALAVVSTLFALGTDRIDDAAAQRAQYSAFARQMIVNLTSLSPSTIDTANDTFQNDTSGKALQQLQDTMGQTTDLVKSQGVTTKGTILSDAVVDSDADSATLLLVSGWTMKNPTPQTTTPTTPATPTPAPTSAPAGAAATDDTVVQTFRWRVVVTKINGQMKLTDIEWVT